MLFSSAFAAPTAAYAETKLYAEDALANIQRNAGFVPGGTAIVTGNCYLFVSKVCESLFGVKYDGEGLYGNYRAKHATGNYYTVSTYETTSKTPTSDVVEGIISFFIKNAAPGDIVHYGAYTTGSSNSSTHTFMINSIDNEKMSIYHANYQTTDYGRNTCHIDYIYWDSFRKNPTSNEKKDGKIYSMNSLFYNKMKSSGLGISINRATNYTDLYYLVGAAVPVLTLTNTSLSSITASWDQIIDASQYQLEYKKAGASSFNTISYTYTGLSYELKNLSLGDSYTFRVRACIGGKWYDWSDEKTITVTVPKITEIKDTLLSDAIQLEWDARSDISGVSVYRRVGTSGNFQYYKDITDIKQTMFVDKNIEYGKTYQYILERYLDYQGKAYTNKSDIKTVTYKLSQPTVAYEHMNVKRVDFNITQNGTSDVFVYYLTDEAGNYVVNQTETHDTNFVFDNLKTGAKYTFACAQKTKLGTGDFAKVTFQVIPPRLKNVRIWVVDKGLKVTFNKQYDITGYYVYRCRTKDGKYTKLGDLNKDTNWYYDKGVKYNKGYYYKVYAYVVSDGKTYTSWVSGPYLGVNYVGTPTGIKVTRTSPTSLKVTFNKSANAKRYLVQYKTSKKGKWKNAGTVKTNSKTFKKLEIGKTYYYRAKAVNSLGSSKFTKTAKKSAGVPQPEMPKAYNSKKGISLNWKPKSHANGYRIYRATSKNGKYYLVKTVNNNKSSWWTDTSAKSGTTYYYKLVAYKKVGKKTYSSAKSAYVTQKH